MILYDLLNVNSRFAWYKEITENNCGVEAIKEFVKRGDRPSLPPLDIPQDLLSLLKECWS